MKSKWLFVLLLTLVLFDASSALAAVGGSGSLPYESWLSTIMDSFTGPVAYVISVCCIAAAGMGYAFAPHESSKFIQTLIYLTLGIGLVIGGKEVLANIMGKSALIAIGG